MKKIAVVGLGKLGLCSALCFANSGYDVQGYDSSLDVIENIKKRKIDNYEPKVLDFLKKKKNFEFSNNFKDILNRRIIFIIVPTPSKKNHEFSNKFIYRFLKKYTLFVNKEKIKKFHIVISSTVMPGSCDKFIRYIEKKTAIKVNKDFYLSYNPEFIALGNVIQGFLNPDIVLIGSTSRNATKELVKIYKNTVRTKNFCKMSLQSAEITKIALNSFITLKISFANLLLRISKKFKKADAMHITKAIGKDQRVSPYYFKPGLPFAGPCFPRDNEAFNYLQKKIKLKNKYITSAIINSNKEHIDFLKKKILSLIRKNNYKKICIAGLAFKNNTSITEKSFGLELAKLFIRKKINFGIYEKNLNNKDPVTKKFTNFFIDIKNIKNFDYIINTNSLNLPNNKIPILDLWKI